MNTGVQHEDDVLDHPVPWPHPHTGRGLGGPPRFDDQLGAWVVSSYADIVDVLRRDGREFCSANVTGPHRAEAFARLLEDLAGDPRAQVAQTYFHVSVLGTDGEVHRREHGFVAKAFTPRRVRELEGRMRALCEELTEAMVGRRDVPFARELAVPLPVQVIAHGLGLPAEGFRDLKRWSDGFQVFFGAPHPSPELIEDFLVAAVEYTDYVTPLIEERRRAPAGDIISVLTGDNDAGDRMSTEEILAMSSMLMLAGNETSTAALAGTLLFLLRTPGLQDQVRADLSLVPALVEEGLRLSTPAQVLFRTATTDTEVAGVPVAEGEHLLLRYAAANRDAARFDDPLRPRLDRPDKRHLAFGRGLHTCVGAPLARAELRIAFETLLARTEAIALSARDAPVVPAGNEMTAGIGELYVDVLG